MGVPTEIVVQPENQSLLTEDFHEVSTIVSAPPTYAAFSQRKVRRSEESTQGESSAPKSASSRQQHSPNTQTSTQTSTPSSSEQESQSLIPPPETTALSREECYEKWGIPLLAYERIVVEPGRSNNSRRRYRTLEEILTERLVWIQYRPDSTRDFYWWPAVRYEGVQEILNDPSLRQRVWNGVSTWQRVQWAGQLFLNEPKTMVAPNLVARRLGSTELLEVDETFEFSQLLSRIVADMACRESHFSKHPDLFEEWHTAMDQVETLLQECLGQPPNPSRTSWLRRAQAAKQQGTTPWNPVCNSSTAALNASFIGAFCCGVMEETASTLLSVGDDDILDHRQSRKNQDLFHNLRVY